MDNQPLIPALGSEVHKCRVYLSSPIFEGPVSGARLPNKTKATADLPRTEDGAERLHLPGEYPPQSHREVAPF